MSLQPSETDKLKMKFGSLIEELGRAKLHFLLYRKLSEARKGKEFLEAWGFWNYTIMAHAQSALLQICRIYDDCRWRENDVNWNPLHLLRFVTDVEKLSTVRLQGDEKQQFDDDLKFLRKKDEKKNILPDRKVINLREWRTKVICHRSQDLVVGGRENFFKVNGLEENEIQELIEMGFLILKHWAHYYKSDYALWISKIEQFILQEQEGVLPVLESLRLRLIEQR